MLLIEISYSILFSADNLGNRLKTSDSDFSDNEMGTFAVGRQIQAVQARVRQAALHLFYHLIKVSKSFLIFSFSFNYIFF